VSGKASSSTKWVGFDVSPTQVVVVHLLVPTSGPLKVEADTTWPVQTGARPAAYKVLFDRVAGYLRDRRIDAVALIGSSVSGRAANDALLQGAELRGVVAAAAASVLKEVVVMKKGTMSKTSSRGKVDRYTSDDDYWNAKLDGTLRKGSREAAYAIIVATRDETLG
jgi:hypothetical protein